MKYAILVPDGMSGLPLERFNDRTCMEVATTPNMDALARSGVVGLSSNVPRGMTPASDVANLSILGYDPLKYYCGRGPLEAANLNVQVTDQDVAFRFNLVTICDGKMCDYSAGHISTTEATVLVEQLNKRLADDKFHFYAGTSYRNLLMVRLANRDMAKELSEAGCWAPHDILNRPIQKYLPKNDELVALMNRSREILKEQEINKVRVDLKQNPANMIWLWGQGTRPDLPSFHDAYGLEGGIISAVDLLKGMGRTIGLEVAEVEGATGYYDTNYEGKADAAVDILSRKDFVFVHVEATDEAGHNGDIREKIRAIENFDRKIVGPVAKYLEGAGDYRILVTPDHPTPIAKRTHTRDSVPFLISGTGIQPDEVTVFSESSARAGSINLKKGSSLMKKFINRS